MSGASAPILIAIVVAWIGALMAVILRKSGRRYVRPLVYLALLFFGVSAVFDILPQSKSSLSWPIFASAVAGGYAIFWAIGRYVAPICPACAMRRFESDHSHASGFGLSLVAIVLGIHCFFDGLGVSAASSVGSSFGLRVFAAIAVHKLPEGFALALMLMAGGRRAWGAFALAAGVEASTLAGAIAGQSLHPSDFWLAIVLANIGGTFLYLTVSGLWDALGPAPAVAEA